jgi:histidyl-tRNA synthetase
MTAAPADRGLGLSAEQAGRVLDLAGTTGSNRDILDRVERDFGRNPKAADGVAKLRELLAVANAAGIPEERLRIDLSICRGLDYYTGTIYETFLTDLPGIGSVCSGGRYDNLAGLYTKQALPGVGASLGLDRLLAAMEELNLLPKESTPAPVLVVQFTAERLGDYQRIARTLRAAGIATEVFPEAKKIGQQLQYAERRGFRIALIAGPDEFAAGVCKIKVLATREERAVPAAELAPTLRQLLAGESGHGPQ